MTNLTKDYFSRVESDPGPYSNFTIEADLTSSTEFIRFVCIGVALSILIFATVIGNVFVMVAIVREKNLNNAGNYLVFSLALADLLVALLVMPIGAVNEVNQKWTMGSVLCDLWTCCDVLCCTASILHLLAIAVDRYWAVTDVDYARNRDKRRIYLAILLVWAVSFVVSIAPLLGWKDKEYDKRIEEKICAISQDLGYQIFATCSSFYVPLVLILILYSRIFQEARRRIRRRTGAASRAMLLVQRPPPPIETRRSLTSPTSTTFESPSCVVDTTLSCDQVNAAGNKSGTLHQTNSVSSTSGTTTVNGVASNRTTPLVTGAVVRLLHIGRREKKPDNSLAKREKKAAKTLAIITGVFVICWLPFFVTALLLVSCATCERDRPIYSFFLWLGYANSTLNPIIYTIFSPDFRSAFRKLLCSLQQTQRPSL